MKIFSVEEDVINMLTKLVWWVDIRFNKGTVWTSIAYFACSSVFICFLRMIDLYYILLQVIPDFSTLVIAMFTYMFAVLIYLLVSWYIFVFVVGKMCIDKKLLTNTKQTPNPNKQNGWLWICRLLTVTPFISGVIEQNTFTSVVVVTIIFSPTFYMLCVDPIPPGLKKEKREEIENKRLQFAPQKN